MFKIEKGIPVTVKRKNPVYDVFDKMEVGDSIFVNNEYKHKIVHHVSSYNTSHLNKKFCTRAEGEGRRVWRIE